MSRNTHYVERFCRVGPRRLEPGSGHAANKLGNAFIDYDVLARPRPGLSSFEKVWIMIRAGAGLWKPGLCPRRT
jgi:hypothetical protein